MEILGICILIILGVFIEHKIYLSRVFPYIGYDCYFNTSEVFEGEQVEIIETVTNPSFLPLASLKSEITTSKYLDFAGNTSAVNDKTRSLASLFSIPGKKRITRCWNARCLKRGIYHIEDTTIIANDILGVCHYNTLVRIKSRLVVLPIPLIFSHSPTGHRELQGNHVVKRFIVEDPFAIAGIREYTQRDSMNQIHWPMSAKYNELMVRSHETTTEHTITVILNMQLAKGQLREEVNDEKLELGIRLAAGELESTLSKSIPIRLMANATTVNHETNLISNEMWGYTHIHELFVCLAGLKNTFTLPLDHFLKEYSSMITSPYVILITTFLDDQTVLFIREKKQLGIYFKIYLIAYSSGKEYFPDLEIYYVLDHINGKKVC